MKPEEKAKELVDSFLNVTVYVDEDGNKETMKDYNSYDTAKQCALICVDEIIETLNLDLIRCMDNRQIDTYWIVVKEEIEKL